MVLDDDMDELLLAYLSEEPKQNLEKVDKTIISYKQQQKYTNYFLLRLFPFIQIYWFLKYKNFR